MKLQMKSEAVTKGVESRSFGMEFNPYIAKILSDDLYSRKEEAVVRETVTNAWDASRGTEPVEIWLPNEFDKQFVVKDYGTGLSEEDIYKVYTTYFGSHSRNEEAPIGGFGLGAKSPLSVTESFHVKSRFNGEEKTYLIYKDSDLPKVSMVHAEPTEERNGLTVVVPAPEEEKHPLYSAALGNLLAHLSGEFTVHNATETYTEAFSKWADSKVLETGDILMHQGGGLRAGLMVLLQGVKYEVPVSDLHCMFGYLTTRDLLEEKYSTLMRDLVSQPSAAQQYNKYFAVILSNSTIVLKADCQEVTPAVSRESLSLGDEAVEYLQDLLIRNLFKLVHQAIDANNPVTGDTFMERLESAISLWDSYGSRNLTDAPTSLSSMVSIHMPSITAPSSARWGDTVNVYYHCQSGGDWKYESRYRPWEGLEGIKKAKRLIIVDEPLADKGKRNANSEFRDNPDGWDDKEETVILHLGSKDTRNFATKGNSNPNLIKLLKTDGEVETHKPYKVQFLGRELEVILTQGRKAKTFLSKGPLKPKAKRASYSGPRVKREKTFGTLLRETVGVELPPKDYFRKKPDYENDLVFYVPVEVQAFRHEWQYLSVYRGPDCLRRAETLCGEAVQILQDFRAGRGAEYLNPVTEYVARMCAKIELVGYSRKDYKEVWPEGKSIDDYVEGFVKHVQDQAFKLHRKTYGKEGLQTKDQFQSCMVSHTKPDDMLPSLDYDAVLDDESSLDHRLIAVMLQNLRHRFGYVSDQPQAVTAVIEAIPERSLAGKFIKYGSGHNCNIFHNLYNQTGISKECQKQMVLELCTKHLAKKAVMKKLLRLHTIYNNYFLSSVHRSQDYEALLERLQTILYK